MKIRLAILLTCIVQGVAQAGSQPAKYAIRAGKILTMVRAGGKSEVPPVINHGIILVSDAKIEAMGPAADVAIPEGYTVIDASDRWVTPGIVEAHAHIAIRPQDGNDVVVPLNPELHIADCIDPEDISVEKAVTGGVTTVHTMPGSGTNLAGFSVITKTDGSRPEQMTVRELGAMKMTQAYNPERRGGDLGYTRMGMSWMLRHILDKGKAYAHAWQAYEEGISTEKPEYKPEYEKMRKVFQGRIPTIVHTYDAWGVMQTSRIFHDEYGLKVIPTHTAYGGHLVADKVATRENVHINIGPRLYDFYMPEGIHRHSARENRFYGMGSQYYQGGVRNLSINTDSVGWSQWGISQEELKFQASMSARLGLDEMAAMQAITINSARALGIDDRVGSLGVGKDADLVVKKGSLLDVTTPIDLVLINGKVVYRRNGADLIEEPKTQ
ncbi:MAG: amidohydrolase family protein [Planctomycetota bacterium]